MMVEGLPERKRKNGPMDDAEELNSEGIEFVAATPIGDMDTYELVTVPLHNTATFRLLTDAGGKYQDKRDEQGRFMYKPDNVEQHITFKCVPGDKDSIDPVEQLPRLIEEKVHLKHNLEEKPAPNFRAGESPPCAVRRRWPKII